MPTSTPIRYVYLHLPAAAPPPPPNPLRRRRKPHPTRPHQRPLSLGYSSASPAGFPISEPCPTTVSYLISCGLSPAVAAACKLRIRSTVRADAVLALFQSYGFGDAHIAMAVRQAPGVLNLDPDWILRPKLDFFASLGVQPPRLMCKI